MKSIERVIRTQEHKRKKGKQNKEKFMINIAQKLNGLTL